MHKRVMGKTGVEVSALGFGAMRMPLVDGKDDQIDEAEAIRMIRKSIDGGVNYLDTAYPYHGGQSEILCGKAMQDGYREKVFIATKMPSWAINSYEDMVRILDEQLEKLQVECIDFYLLHTITEEYWELYKRIDFKRFFDEAAAAGKIKYRGFSFHDNIHVFKEVVDGYDWDFCQIQLNYMDENYQAGLEGMRYAAERGLGVVIMEPLRGGMLARTEMPEELEKIWAGGHPDWSPAEWALRWVWDQREVSLVLSGMSNMEQVEDNLRTATNALPGSLSSGDRDRINAARDFYKGRLRVNCTNCRYCMPCPAGVNIPELFWGYNHDGMFDDFGKGKYWATNFVKMEARAFNCVECGACEEHCPQNIAIIDNLKKIDELYGRS